MSPRRFLLAALALFAAVGTGRVTFAEPAAENAQKKEAQARLDKAIRLLNEENFGAALAELTQVYQLAPHTVVRYNIGLVYAAMGRPVEAVSWLEACLSDPTPLTREERSRAAAKLNEQRARVGTLMVTANVKDAIVEIDSLEAGRTPLAKPIQVASGIHVVAVVASGYIPMRREVKVAGLTETPVAFDLIPSQGSFARLTISTELPGADVVVDGVIAGKTPLPGSLKLSPGAHRVELRRPGYVSVQRDVTLGEGDAQTLKEEPREDADWIAANGGSLALTFSETHAVVKVNGVSRGEYRGSLRLAPGIHRLRAERSGFAAVERDVEVTAYGTTTLSIRFEPNPGTLVKIEEDYERRRNWGIAATVGGAVVASAGAAVLGFYLIQHDSDCSNPTESSTVGRCPNNRVGIGLGGLGVGLGAAALVTGVVLTQWNEDPHRYDVRPSGQRLTRLQVLPAMWPWDRGLAVGVTGAF
jgi:hypothetical protein